MDKFWKFKNLTNEAGDPTGRALELNGTIAEESWFDDDVTPKAFRNELYAGDGDVTVRINSPGGDCIAASQIYTMLVEYPGKVTVMVDGLAASAASVVAMAGDEVWMAPTALMMIHNPLTGAWGDHNEMQKAIDVLEEVKESIINAYQIKTGLQRAKLSRLMEDETWMNAKKAMELGFADHMMNGEKNAEAFAYSAAATVRSITNKITAKAEKEHPKQGAKVSDLLMDLYDKKFLI